jgi:hypothetical protein
LNYFYLYLKIYIEFKYDIKCERADAKILTMPILEKIVDYIKKSDLLIADCSGRNSNVFYELGIAHALNKKVILITKDPISDAPSDVKHFEFIPYSLDKDVEFLNKIDNAIYNALVERYEVYYEPALAIFNDFKKDTNAAVEMVQKDSFLSKVMASEHTGDLPSLDDKIGLIEFVLPKIIADSSKISIMQQITAWLSEKYGR